MSSCSAFERLTTALEKEQGEELETMVEWQKTLTARGLEEKGVCLASLTIASTSIGMGGRTLLALRSTNANNPVLPPHTFTPGDVVGLCAKGDKPEKGMVTGVVARVGEEEVSVALKSFGGGEKEGGDGEHGDGLPQVVRMDKLANEVSYKRMYIALNVLADPERRARARGKRPFAIAFEKRSPPPPLPQDSASSGGIKEWANLGLNETQKTAVRAAVASRDVFCIHGPPGTGKTTTLVEVVGQILAAPPEGEGIKTSILACAPSNQAVDNLALALIDAGISVVRVGHPARLTPAMAPFALEAVAARSDGAELVADIRNEMEANLRAVSKTKSKREAWALYKANRGLRKEARSRERDVLQSVLDSAEVVLATTSGCDSRILRSRTFDVAILDEAAQGLEPASWIPLLKATRAILAGDHLQLAPTVKSRDAGVQAALGKTIFDRFMDLPCASDISIMLDVQYRMNAEICSWASSAMYESKLVAHESVAGGRLEDLDHVAHVEDLTDVPMVVVDTTGCDMDERTAEGSGSKYNDGEASVVVALIEELTGQGGLYLTDIGIITPYQAQVRLLRSLLPRDAYPGLHIGTVDAFQGGEREAIILSLVRSNDDGDVGFLADKRRLNVAVTRARKWIGVVANIEVLETDPFLSGFAEHGMEAGMYRSAEEVVSS